MKRSAWPTTWYALTGLAFVEWTAITAFGVVWLVGAAVAIANGSVHVSDWRDAYVAVVFTAALTTAGIMYSRFLRRERGAKRLALPAAGVAVGIVFFALIGVVGD